MAVTVHWLWLEIN